MEREGLNYIPNRQEEAKLAYNPSFDERDYENFSELSLKEQQRLKEYTQRQLETYMGERVQVAESVTRYDIVEGKIFSASMGQSLEDMMINGINFRREHGNPIDFEREDAELAGVKLMQPELVNEDIPPGTTFLVVSLPGIAGSDYTNNFFDTFSVQEDEKGRYVEHRRFLSNLTADEYRQRVAPFKVFENLPKAEDFLKDPIKVTGFDNSGELQKYLNGGIKALEKDEMDKINKINAPLITSYINSLVGLPNDHFIHRLKYNAILNQSDMVLDAIKNGDSKFLDSLYYRYAFDPNYAEDISWAMGTKNVRKAQGPCPGTSEGFSLGSFMEPGKAPFSVSEFGKLKDRFGDRTFDCPHCGWKNLRPENQLIENCQNPDCGKNVRC